MGLRWRDAMDEALYGARGFFRSGAGPAGHFRTSAHASPTFANAILHLIHRVDAALDHPTPFDVIDIGAGHAELLTALATALTRPAGRDDEGVTDVRGAGNDRQPRDRHTPAEPLAGRVRFVAVEKAGRPQGVPGVVQWRESVPEGVTGVVLATEWLDNVPLDVVQVDDAGELRRVHVEPDGSESLGERADAADRFWLARWWPLDDAPPGTRAEIGATRDRAWSAAVESVARGIALAVDYGHVRGRRADSLTGYRLGRQVAPVPDGTTDITAHVAMDAVAAAAGGPYRLVSQRDALRALGVGGARPALALASTDPAAYLRALSGAGAAAELTDPAGLGGHWWLLHPVGVAVDLVPEGDGSGSADGHTMRG